MDEYPTEKAIGEMVYELLGGAELLQLLKRHKDLFLKSKKIPEKFLSINTIC